mgnify:CR=1 FL=1
MIEHFTEGIVLESVPKGELDRLVTIYTKDLGKVTATTKSARKITSKVSGHLMPGNFVKLRIVENKSVQAMDALSEKPKCDMRELLKFLNFLDAVIPHGEIDINFWNLVKRIIAEGRFEPKIYKYVLGILGFGEGEGFCDNCRKNEIAHFSLNDIMFLCSGCVERFHLRPDEAVEI